jgi:Zn-dependent protease
MSNISFTENGLKPEISKILHKEPLPEEQHLYKENTYKPIVNKNETDRSLTNKKTIWAVLGSALAVLGKFKFLFVFLKLGKFSTTFISMFIMIWIYAVTFGWAFGIGFVGLLFVHEMGHYIMARRLDIDVSTPLFIPFVGALISMKQMPKDATTEAKLALGGPVLGSIGALVCVLFYYVDGHDIFLALAYTGFMLNLFNLIPMYPIDGGRIVSAISPKIWLVGIPIMIIVAYRFFNPILLVFIIFGILQAISQRKNPNKLYYDTEPSARLTFAALYFGLIALLGYGMYYIHNIHGTGYHF